VLILGIETSCDETSLAIVNERKEILLNLIHSQIEIHQAYGGVVPEIAARSHIEIIDKLLAQAEQISGIGLKDIDAIAVTSGPGLIGGLIVGLMTAKGLAHYLDKPLIEVNHLEGHALAPKLTEDIEFPYLLLLISGGHCQILIVKDVSDYEMLGSTIDDALGEAFDKFAKMLGLPYPGGPMIEKMAQNGNENKYILPKAMVGRDNCDFSFSGIKTALKNIIDIQKDQGALSQDFICDLSASFQKTICTILEDRLTNAMAIYEKRYSGEKRFVISGGVAANNYIRSKLQLLCDRNGYQLFVPPLKLCTDNAAMIAYAGMERFKKGYISDLFAVPKSRWPLDGMLKEEKRA